MRGRRRARSPSGGGDQQGQRAPAAVPNQVVSGSGIQEPGQRVRGHGRHCGNLIPWDRSTRVIRGGALDRHTTLHAPPSHGRARRAGRSRQGPSL
eukprot:3498883-Alexandrium_andersonii.AAC.1